VTNEEFNASVNQEIQRMMNEPETPKEHYERELGGPLTDDVVKRIRHDVEIAGHAYDMGLQDGMARAYRMCSAHLLEQAQLCEAGLSPSSETLRILAAIFDAEAWKLRDEDENA